MKRILIHPAISIVLVLAFVAVFLCIPVVAFYVLPKAIVWMVNYIVHFVGWHVPFNLFTWALAMYLLWITGVVRIATRELKHVVGELKD